jgi:hypothetical protein
VTGLHKPYLCAIKTNRGLLKVQSDFVPHFAVSEDSKCDEQKRNRKAREQRNMEEGEDKPQQDKKKNR